MTVASNDDVNISKLLRQIQVHQQTGVSYGCVSWGLVVVLSWEVVVVLSWGLVVVLLMGYCCLLIQHEYVESFYKSQKVSFSLIRH